MAVSKEETKALIRGLPFQPQGKCIFILTKEDAQMIDLSLVRSIDFDPPDFTDYEPGDSIEVEITFRADDDHGSDYEITYPVNPSTFQEEMRELFKIFALARNGLKGTAK
jgi:hypothetical protein